eukprot:TRINITY_DN6768_c0_g2_i1.p2 TRINITY_DN6768_c0_g2~~TRINITY_DN6768_c0_g2_i1.p2  ORF type:complete len:102 (+),score=2.05 TRINITY_DN6768_c0_g2_i1:36-341(+)
MQLSTCNVQQQQCAQQQVLYVQSATKCRSFSSAVHCGYKLRLRDMHRRGLCLLGGGGEEGGRMRLYQPLPRSRKVAICLAMYDTPDYGHALPRSMTVHALF